MSKAANILLASLLGVTVLTSLFFYTETRNLQSQVTNLKQEIVALRSANLTTAIGIIEVPPYSEGNWWGNNHSYVWITGWVFNYGASMAKNAGIEVVAYDQENAILMNYTVPIVGYGVFSTNENKSLLPEYLQLTSLQFGNVLSNENATVRLSIFHEGVFSNSTMYQVNPVWENS
jgi:hypothetical protein